MFYGKVLSNKYWFVLKIYSILRLLLIDFCIFGAFFLPEWLKTLLEKVLILLNTK